MITRKQLEHIETNGNKVVYLLHTHTNQNFSTFANVYRCEAQVCGFEDLHSNALYLSARNVLNVNPNGETNEATLTDYAIFDLFDEMINE